MNHQLILKYLFERMNKSVVENDNKTLGKLLYVIQAIIQDSSNTKYISFLKKIIILIAWVIIWKITIKIQKMDQIL